MPKFETQSKVVLTAARLNALDRVRHKVKVSLPGSGSYNHADIQTILDYVEELEATTNKQQSQLRDAANKVNDLIKKIK